MITAQTITLTTNGSGAATGYTRVFNGLLKALIYTKTDFANGVDFTITTETTGQTLWTQADVNAAAIKYPLAAAHDTAGVAATLDGTRAMRCEIPIVNERVQVVIAQGGATKTGAITVIVDGAPA
jgi:hypothetical protein